MSASEVFLCLMAGFGIGTAFGAYLYSKTDETELDDFELYLKEAQRRLENNENRFKSYEGQPLELVKTLKWEDGSVWQKYNGKFNKN